MKLAQRVIVRGVALLVGTAPLALGGAAPAMAATPVVASSALLTAGNGTLVGPGGATASFGVLAYQSSSGAVIVSLRICGSACRDYSTNTASLAVTTPNETVTLTADVPAIGPVDLAFDAAAGNSFSYQCAGPVSTFSAEGLVVQQATNRGTIGTDLGPVGTWSVSQSGCSLWATTAAVQYVTG